MLLAQLKPKSLGRRHYICAEFLKENFFLISFARRSSIARCRRRITPGGTSDRLR
jgi:hypothetical protein